MVADLGVVMEEVEVARNLGVVGATRKDLQRRVKAESLEVESQEVPEVYRLPHHAGVQ